MKTNRLHFAVLCLLLVVQVLIYVNHAGAGFITDDFNWLDNVVKEGTPRYFNAFGSTTGFFRPLTGMSFAIQYALHGLNPRAFGLFNLFLHLLNIVLVYLLLSGWQETRRFALAATILFALNAKGVNMAVMWISGRTTLLATCFLLSALLLYQKNGRAVSIGRRLTGLAGVTVFFWAALLCKESVIAAPLFIFIFAYLERVFRDRRKPFLKHSLKPLISAFSSVIPFIAATVVYFLLRVNSDAFDAFNAPTYYRLSFTPGLLLKNIGEYVIRAGLLDFYLFILLVLPVLIWQRVGKVKGRPLPYHAFWTGIAWFCCFLSPMLPLAARSDLYVYLPQVGLHAAFLVMISGIPYFDFLFATDGTRPPAPSRTFTSITAFGLSLILIAWCGYLGVRVQKEGNRGAKSTRFVKGIIDVATGLPEKAHILIIDGQTDRSNGPSATVAYGFQPLLNLYFPGKHFTGSICTPETPIPTEAPNDGELFRFYWNGETATRHYTGAERRQMKRLQKRDRQERRKQRKQRKQLKKLRKDLPKGNQEQQE